MKIVLKWVLIAFGVLVAVYINMILGGIFVFIGGMLLLRASVAKRVESETTAQ
jgi:hypothetical protein